MHGLEEDVAGSENKYLPWYTVLLLSLPHHQVKGCACACTRLCTRAHVAACASFDVQLLGMDAWLRSQTLGDRATPAEAAAAGGGILGAGLAARMAGTGGYSNSSGAGWAGLGLSGGAGVAGTGTATPAMDKPWTSGIGAGMVAGGASSPYTAARASSIHSRGSRGLFGGGGLHGAAERFAPLPPRQGPGAGAEGGGALNGSSANYPSARLFTSSITATPQPAAAYAPAAHNSFVAPTPAAAATPFPPPPYHMPPSNPTPMTATQAPLPATYASSPAYAPLAAAPPSRPTLATPGYPSMLGGGLHSMAMPGVMPTPYIHAGEVAVAGMMPTSLRLRYLPCLQQPRVLAWVMPCLLELRVMPRVRNTTLLHQVCLPGHS